MTKTIVVLGATGNQGGSVAGTFLQNSEWHVRAVTRNASSAKAESLRSRGAEVVEADLDDRESLERAFAGAHAIFAFSDTLSILAAGPASADIKPLPEQNLMAWAAACELRQLKNAVDAAARVPTLERLVVSVLQNVSRLSGGKYTQVYHFDSKAEAEEYARETYPELWSKTSSYIPGWFLTNILPGGLSPPQKSENGTLLFCPGIKSTTQVPVFVPEEDAGPIVEALVKEPTGGKKVIGQRESMKFAEFLELFAKTTERKAEYVAGPTDPAELPLPPFLQGPVYEMNSFWDEFGYDGGDTNVITPKDLTYPPALGTVAQYLQKKDWE
ncbi:hypothetical protein PWT90_02051 [Aphanocladium album]|nr:hypothetical protein PWT90_02051 [Aphanocladium album]